MERIEVLAKYLDCQPDEISEAKYGENTFEHGSRGCLVLTDLEADEAGKAAIKDSLWAFNLEFISSHTKHGLEDCQIKAMREAQGQLCESFSPIVEALIEDMDHFCDDAMSADGRGHFLSDYDGEENEEGEYYIYRTN